MSRVLALMSKPLTGVYHPTQHAVQWWFHCLNREIFDTCLPCVRLRLNTDNYSWGYYVAPDLIGYRRVYQTKQQFVAVLGHEMVHHWQAVNGLPYTPHNQQFYRWRRRFLRHGILLVEHGDVHIHTLH